MPIVIRRRRALALLVGAGLLAAAIASRFVCLSAWIRYGIAVDLCPEGTVRPTFTVQANGLRRGAPGPVRVSATAHYTPGPSDAALAVPLSVTGAEMSLVDGRGTESPLELSSAWKDDAAGGRSAPFALPEVPDGDYRLRARLRTRAGDGAVEAPLPVYAPARVHVLTDRPVYQPGDVIRFRALVVRARDLTPLDGRPGRWVVIDPSGVEVLDERAPAGPWGVAFGRFPLDAGAAEGDWRLRWVSGTASDEVVVRVEPFRLPRFRVQAAAARPFYQPGDRLSLDGSVLYSSGAPVANADLELSWSSAGAWPPPTEWMTGRLPKRATSDARGRFALELPAVPADLKGQATLFARIAATDPAGDRVESRAAILLSEDAIRLSAVTELAGGLVQGFNNRVFLRATTAAGRVLAGAELVVRRAWEPRDPGIVALADADGVAAFQVDPGPPVNVVIPPMPVRVPPASPPVSRSSVRDLLDDQGPTLADLGAIDGWDARLQPCARYLRAGGRTVPIAVQVDAAGTVVAVAAGSGHAEEREDDDPSDAGPADPLAACAASSLRDARMPAGRPRLFAAQFAFSSPDLPALEPQFDSPAPPADGVVAAIERAALDGRPCLPASLEDGEMPRQLAWRTRAGSRDIEVNWAVRRHGLKLADAALSCVQARFVGLRLPRPAAFEALGAVWFGVEPAPRRAVGRPEPITVLGYEFLVLAREDGKAVGTTRWRMNPGTVPAVRMRATPVLAEPGGTVEVEILRGPDFGGLMPKKLRLAHDGGAIEAEVDAKTRSARFALPVDADGWYEAEFAGAKARVYVPPRASLALDVKPAQERYAPGQTAALAVRTTAGGRPTTAAVGLFGVDESLGQIAALPGPDELARLRALPTMSSPAFEALDAQALALGRIRGANAAAATVLRVTARPQRAPADAPVVARADTIFDPVAELTDRFYVVLAELYAQVRAWEEKAPGDEKMQPATQARLWERSLDRCRSRGERVDDAFGRRLRLGNLPPDLLALTDPRAVVVAGTRLPEDVENWSAWVAREQP